jgi:cell division septal protein FtsQ
MSRLTLTIGEHCSRRTAPLAARRRQHRRRPVVILATGVVLAVVLGLLVRWLVTSPLFGIERVETGPYRFTAADQLEELLAGALDQNIWSFSTGSFADTLLSLPWIENVRIVRRLPATLRVQLQEWQPLVAVTAARPGGGNEVRERILLADGRVVEFPPHLPSPALPVLVGCNLTAGEYPGRWQISGADVAHVLELVKAIRETGLEVAGPVDYIVSDASGFSIQLGEQGGRLLVGTEEFHSRLRLFLNTRSKIARDAIVDLRFKNRVGVLERV